MEGWNLSRALVKRETGKYSYGDDEAQGELPNNFPHNRKKTE